MRMTLFIQRLLGGGAERVMSGLASYWAARGETVHLVTRPMEEPDFYPLHPAVCRRFAAEPMSRVPGAGFLLRVQTLREQLVETRPDVVVSFLDVTNLEALMAARGLGIPVIVSERIDPRQMSIPAHHGLLRRLLYPHAACVIVQTESVRRWASFVPPERVAVIPNFVPAPPTSPPEPREPLIVGIGRLAEQKGFDLLLAAFARIARQLPEWRLVILGEGMLRSALERQVKTLGLGARVALPGVVTDTHAWLRRAGLFVLSSRFEGFPNVLLEAMANGAPVVATDCPSGPSDIVLHGHNGLLVPVGVAPLAAAMLDLCRAPEERVRLGARAVEVTERFHPDRIMAAWDDICRRCVTGRSAHEPRRAGAVA